MAEAPKPDPATTPTAASAPTILAGGPISPGAPLGMGAEVGGYRIESLLGEGGMGVVYLARQERPDRLVALKLLRSDLTVPRLLRRFEHEAEILGRLQHPGIAQIFEAGTFQSPAGPRPFFAMEYVRGSDVKAFASRAGLDTRARVELMVAICEAVQHAHQNGVIHRDLKPGNILVDTAGQPKILDFGVARLADPEQTAHSVVTEHGQLVGTIPYMSPEQVGEDTAAIDTRSDVYTLGVILHELLCGQLPHNFGRFSLPEMARVIREEPPERLSTVNPALGGDLENIVLKALEKDRERRYASAADLAADLGRVLRDEPVLARPASTWYQFRKFAKRRRALVAGASATLLALVVGVIGTSYGLLEARRQRDEALAAGARETTQREIAEAVNQFLNTDLLGAVEPAASDVAGRGKDVSMRAVLDEASRRIDAAGAVGGRFVDKPTVEAAIRVQLTNTYAKLGEMDAARVHAERALALRQQHLGPTDQSTLEAAGNLAVVFEQLGRFEEAEVLNRRNVEAFERVRGKDHPETITARNNLGSSLQSMGRLAEAEPVYRACVESAERAFGAEHPETLFYKCNLGGLLSDLGRERDAEPLLRASMDGFRKARGPDDPETIWAMGRLANTLTSLDQADEAGKLYQAALEARRKVLGPGHPETLITLNNYGWWLHQQGRFEESAAVHREGAQRRTAILGPEHPTTLASLNNLGSAMQQLGKLDEAEAIFRDILTRRMAVLGPTHPDTLSTINNLGSLCSARARTDEAAALFRRAFDGYRQTLGDDHTITATLKMNLAAALLMLNQREEAASLVREALATRRKLLPPGHADIAKAQELLRESGG